MKNKYFPFFIEHLSEQCNKMFDVFFIFLVLLVISGCTTVRDMVVLVQDADGKVGKIAVTTKGGTKTLTVANTMVEVTGFGESISDPKKIEQSQIDSLFTDSISALPLEAVSFLLYFMSDSTELTAESKTLITEILSLVNDRKFYEISIIGHTDTIGDDEYNMRLSSARAEAVRVALFSHGIRPGQTEIRYHGKRDPVVPTGDNVREPRNRRVEVVVK
jgi:hypothetical protein